MFERGSRRPMKKYCIYATDLYTTSVLQICSQLTLCLQRRGLCTRLLGGRDGELPAEGHTDSG